MMLTTTDLARWLDLHPKTVERLARRGAIVGIKTEARRLDGRGGYRRWQFNPLVVERFLREDGLLWQLRQLVRDVRDGPEAD